MLAGHAEFTVAGETIDAPAGTLVFIPDVAAERGAVARADETTVLVIGGPADAPHPDLAVRVLVRGRAGLQGRRLRPGGRDRCRRGSPSGRGQAQLTTTSSPATTPWPAGASRRSRTWRSPSRTIPAPRHGRRTTPTSTRSGPTPGSRRRAESSPLRCRAKPSARSESMECDVAVLGGGPGGYPAAIRAAQLGASVALIEQARVGRHLHHRWLHPHQDVGADGACAQGGARDLRPDRRPRQRPRARFRPGADRTRTASSTGW